MGFEDYEWGDSLTYGADRDKTLCEDWPLHIKLYWKYYEGVSDEFMVSRRCSVMEFIDFPAAHHEHWIPPSHYEFFAWSILLGFLLFIARYVLTEFVFRPFAEKRVRDKAKIENFCESGIKIAYYGCTWFYCLYILWQQPFFWDKHLAMNQHRLRNLYEFPFEFFLIYYIQMGWYLQCLVTHFTHDSQKEDHLVMLTHHVVTLSLIYGSYRVGYIEWGVLVLFSMDLCDVFLEILRAMRLCVEMEDWQETLIFLPLPISWFILRLWFYWDRILYHSMMQVPVTASGWEQCNHYLPFMILLIALFLMNIYWFFLIVRIAYRKVALGVVLHDSREQKESQKDK